MPKFNVGKAINAANQRLKEAEVKPQIKRNGGTLVIRATVPSRLGVGTERGEFSLGIPANKDGVKFAESKCHDLADELMRKTFKWEDWRRNRAPKPNEIPVSQLVQNFKAEYLKGNLKPSQKATRKRKPIKESTWRYGWQKTLERLPQDQPLSEAMVLAVIITTEPHTETRKRTCQRLQALCDYAGIKIDLSSHSGDYGHQSLNPRDIPDDATIIEWRDRVPNPAWQWVYGMMATFGLRPHECFLCEFIDVHTVRVFDETKTGYHVTRAIPPEWAEQWNLIEIQRPKVSAKRLSDYGNRNKGQFRRYKIPFPAYNLRHAYAIRGTVKEEMGSVAMAKMMGHSVAVHEETYQEWIKDAEIQKKYEQKILNRSNPPKIPL